MRARRKEKAEAQANPTRKAQFHRCSLGLGMLGGIVNFGSQLAAIAAPIVTGYVVQITHSFFWAFGAAAAFLTVGIIAYVFLLGRIEAIPDHRRSPLPRRRVVFSGLYPRIEDLKAAVRPN